MPKRKAGMIKILKEKLAALNERRAALEGSISSRSVKLARLAETQEHERVALRNLHYDIGEIRNRIFARTPLPPQFLKTRNVLVRKMLLARSGCITVAQQKALRREIAAGMSTLQETCEHRFVFSYDGYAGSRDCDFDDGYFGHRVCVLCNADELSANKRIDVYKTLAEDGTRLVRRDLRNNKDRPISDEREWFAISFIHRLFEASAGFSIVQWPKAFDKENVLKF